MLTEQQRIELIGALGEDIVNIVLKEAGLNVKKSENKYDSEKDFLVDGYKVEVKTVVPWFTENALTIDASQYRKCYNADCVIFVCVPSKGLTNLSTNKYDGNIYIVSPKEVKWRTKQTRAGLPKFLINIDQPGVRLCYKIEDTKILDTMRNLTTSRS